MGPSPERPNRQQPGRPQGHLGRQSPVRRGGATSSTGTPAAWARARPRTKPLGRAALSGGGCAVLRGPSAPRRKIRWSRQRFTIAVPAPVIATFRPGAPPRSALRIRQRNPPLPAWCNRSFAAAKLRRPTPGNTSLMWRTGTGAVPCFLHGLRQLLAASSFWSHDARISPDQPGATWPAPSHRPVLRTRSVLRPASVRRSRADAGRRYPVTNARAARREGTGRA
jgi:hypothetical protein